MPSSSEYLCLGISSKNLPVCKLHTFCHPPGDNLPFIEQLMEIITSNADSAVAQLFLGDFNLHWSNPNNPAVSCLKSFLNDQELTQHCDQPTYIEGETLDLIISKGQTITLDSITPCDWSDHHSILFYINREVFMRKAQSLKSKIWKRDLRSINSGELVAQCKSALSSQADLVEVQSLTDAYNSTITNIMDDIAPLQQKNASTKISKLL